MDARAGRTLTAFCESAPDLSGMLLSAPAGKNGTTAGKFGKTKLEHVIFDHGEDTLPPPVADMLMVTARESSGDGSAWNVIDTTFDPAGAIRRANEPNWLGPRAVRQIYPPVFAE